LAKWLIAPICKNGFLMPLRIGSLGYAAQTDKREYAAVMKGIVETQAKSGYSGRHGHRPDFRGK
jgi:hypothetical protein